MISTIQKMQDCFKRKQREENFAWYIIEMHSIVHNCKIPSYQIQKFHLLQFFYRVINIACLIGLSCDRLFRSSLPIVVRQRAFFHNEDRFFASRGICSWCFIGSYPVWIQSPFPVGTLLRYVGLHSSWGCLKYAGIEKYAICVV